MLNRCFGRPCTCASTPGGSELGAQALAGLAHGLFAMRARLVELARDVRVVGWLQKAKRQILQLPLDLPDAQAIGQRREHLLGFQRQRGRARLLGRGVPAQRLQARRQAQQHHAQVARESQQHLAHPLGLLLAALGLDGGLARRALHRDQLARVLDQAGVGVAERIAHDFFRTLQKVGGVDQVRGGAQRRHRTDRLQDAGHTVGMGQRRFAGVEKVAAQQRLGKRTRTLQRARFLHGGDIDQRHGRRLDIGQLHDRCGVGWRCERLGLHGDDSRKSRTICTCSGCTSVGAWPTPGNSTSFARGPRAPISCAVARASRSDSAPRSNNVGQRTRS